MKRVPVFLAAALAATASNACETALVLAIDVSGSVDAREYRLQMDGLATALRDPTVADALVAGQAQVAVLQWSGLSRQKVSTSWTQTLSASDVAALADQVATAPRAYRNYSTALGEAMTAAARLFDEVDECERKVIDMSGDGKSNEGAEPAAIRDALVPVGVQINGLAIETGDERITAYFRENVMGGPGAFVVTATGYDDYPRAIRRKLLQELTKPIVRRPAAEDDDRLAASEGLSESR